MRRGRGKEMEEVGNKEGKGRRKGTWEEEEK